MSKCWNCGVRLTDPDHICPLCKCIVETDGDESACEKKYPYLYAERGYKKMQLALNIYLFAAIVTELILCVIDIATGGNPGWVIMVGAFLVYGFITLKVSIQMHTGYRLKMMMQSLLGVAVLLVIDMETGFHGWSVNFVLPGVFILINIAIIVLMIVNNRNWQSYIPLQLLLIALSVLPFVLFYLGIVTNIIVACASMFVAVITFVGTLIVGGKRARDELFRRFHV